MHRRDFLKEAGALATAAAAALPGDAAAQSRPADPPGASDGHATRGAAPIAGPESDPSPDHNVLTTERSVADDMVDVIKALGFEYVCSNPGSSFRGLHESLINYGGNSKPEFITCCHEESSVAMAHGYFKITGKPLAVLAHGTVGLQHAAMAVYNAYCDQVPFVMFIGNTLDATQRRPGVEWAHSVQDAAVLVRDFSKWDDIPISIQHFAESSVRAYKIAMTPPMGPVVVVIDGDLQERPTTLAAKPRIPKLTLAAPPQGDAGAVAEAARLLVAAENPVIVADRAARTANGMRLLVDLAETLQAAVIDQGGRLNFPSRHPLCQSGRGPIAEADVVLGLEVTDFFGTVNVVRDQLHKTFRRIAKPSARMINISSRDLLTKANYQDFQRFPDLDLSMAADAEATLPALVEAVKRLMTDDRRRVAEERGRKLATARQKAYEAALDSAAYGWDASPISTARLCAELWALIEHEDWSLVSYLNPVSGWPMRLWNFDKPYQFIGGSGGSGIGYTAPAAVGAALANRAHGRLTVNIQPDGDLMYAPGVLWTAAHHRIPLLTVMHNNRAYHQEVMHLQRIANRHNRGVDRAWIGTTLDDPPIDYAMLARSMGLVAEGPISDPKELAPALTRAIAAVKRGEPALVDVVTQPR